MRLTCPLDSPLQPPHSSAKMLCRMCVLQRTHTANVYTAPEYYPTSLWKLDTNSVAQFRRYRIPSPNASESCFLTLAVNTPVRAFYVIQWWMQAASKSSRGGISGGEFGRQQYHTTPHYMTSKRITNNKLLSSKSPWVPPGLWDIFMA